MSLLRYKSPSDRMCSIAADFHLRLLPRVLQLEGHVHHWTVFKLHTGSFLQELLDKVCNAQFLTPTTLQVSVVFFAHLWDALWTISLSSDHTMYWVLMPTTFILLFVFSLSLFFFSPHFRFREIYVGFYHLIYRFPCIALLEHYSDQQMLCNPSASLWCQQWEYLEFLSE